MPKWTSRKPWERQEGESGKAFEAFSVYLELGENRSIRAVGQKLGKSRALLERWSATYDWVDRAKAYDAELQKKAHAEAIKGRREMVERHIDIALKMQKKALEALEGLHPAELAPKDLIAMMREGTRLEQDIRTVAMEEFEGREDGNLLALIEGLKE